MACYELGQQFMAHEDAFPTPTMLQNSFQRRATLLVYLNDVASGGGTHFLHLGVTVRPQRGRALLFFPAKADGSADARSVFEFCRRRRRRRCRGMWRFRVCVCGCFPVQQERASSIRHWCR